MLSARLAAAFLGAAVFILARALGLRAGVDIVRGPEENAFYIIVGSSWR